MTTRIYQGTNQARGDGRRLQCRLVGLRCATRLLVVIGPANAAPAPASRYMRDLHAAHCSEAFRQRYGLGPAGLEGMRGGAGSPSAVPPRAALMAWYNQSLRIRGSR
jgi:hypothetical protein